jgi:hypothetical protein
MPLTPEKIAEMDALTGFKTPANLGRKSRADEIRALGMQPVTPPKPTVLEKMAGFSMDKAGDMLDPTGLAKTGIKTGLENIKDAAKTVVDKYKGAKETVAKADEAFNKSESIGEGLAITGDAALDLVTKSFGGAAEIFGDSLLSVIPDSVKKAVSDPNSKIVQDFKKFTDNMTPEAKQMFSSLSQKAKENPEIANAVKNSIELVLSGAGFNATGAVKGVVEGQLEKPIVRTINEAVPVAEKMAQKTSNTLDEAIEIGRAPLTDQMEQEAFKRGDITQSGILGKRKVKPSIEDGKVGEALEPLVQQGRVSAKDPLKSGAEINSEVSSINGRVKELVKDPQYNQPFTGNGLDKVLGKVKSQNEILFGGDKTIETAYDTVLNEFKKFLKTKNVEGLIDARQEFDSFVRSKYPDIFKRDKFGNMNPADNAKKNAFYDVRTAVNEYAADLLDQAQLSKSMGYLKATEITPLVEKAKNFPKVEDFIRSEKSEFSKKRNFTNPAEYSTTVEDDLREIWDIANVTANPSAGRTLTNSLRRESYLLRAIENIGIKEIKGTSDTNILQRMVQDHPWLKVALPSGVVGGTVTGALLSH